MWMWCRWLGRVQLESTCTDSKSLVLSFTPSIYTSVSFQPPATMHILDGQSGIFSEQDAEQTVAKANATTIIFFSILNSVFLNYAMLLYN
jgi:hypothetical protein